MNYENFLIKIKKIFRYFKTYKIQVLFEYAYLEFKLFLRGNFINSFSQWGEDVHIDKFLGNKKNGFYVDIGAYDPTRFSNTKRFYLKGWHGINIEPDPLRIKKFLKERPKDINLNIGIANKSGFLDFFKFDPQTLSTFSKSSADNYKKQGHFLRETLKIKVSTIDQVLEKYSNSKMIDFLSIDTEGYDFLVLRRNNWKKFRPKIICIEDKSTDVKKFLNEKGYKLIHQNNTNSIFSSSLYN